VMPHAFRIESRGTARELACGLQRHLIEFVH
jgi:hypothetical protein